MSKPSKNMPMPTSSMMRRLNGPTGSRSSRLPELTDVMCFLPCVMFLCGACARLPLIQPALCGRVAVPVERRVVSRDHHALDVEMIVKALGAEFAAGAGIVDAAPGRRRIEAVMIVDPDDAGLHPRRHAMGARHVACA